MRHSASAYRNGRCSCVVCKADHTVRYLAESDARAARLAKDPSIAPHGVWSTYVNWRCRCQECRAAAAIGWRWNRERRKQRQAAG
jgi:hypothetical protein